MSLAQLLRKQGNLTKRATCSLQCMAGSVRCFNTRDLKEAKALLEELAA